MELKRRSCSRLRVSQVEQSVKENWGKKGNSIRRGGRREGKDETKERKGEERRRSCS